MHTPVKLIPVISLESIIEMDRGRNKERLSNNIESLKDINCRIIIEDNDQIVISSLNYDEISGMVDEKNAFAESSVNLVIEMHYWMVVSESREELLENLQRIINRINDLINENVGKNESIITVLTRAQSIARNLIDDYVPERFSYYSDTRSRIGLSPKEINNLAPTEIRDLLHKRIPKSDYCSILEIGCTDLKLKVMYTMLHLNAIGYWSDKIKNKDRQKSLTFDCLHGFYGCYCHSLASFDKRFINKLKATYCFLGINTILMFFTRRRSNST